MSEIQSPPQPPPHDEQEEQEEQEEEEHDEPPLSPLLHPDAQKTAVKPLLHPTSLEPLSLALSPKASRYIFLVFSKADRWVKVPCDKCGL